MKREEWEMVRLGDVCKFVGGGTPTKSNQEYYTGSIPWATVSDMSTDIISDTIYHITEEAIKNSATNLIEKNTIVISTHVGVGKVCIISKDTAINQDLKAVFPDEKRVFKKYLFHWFKAIAPTIIRNSRGGTVKGVTLQFISGLEIPLPPLDVQRRIADVLDKVTELIDLRKKQLEKLDELVKARFVELFGDPEHNEKQWDVFKLDTLCSVSSSKRIYQNELSMEGVPFLRISDLVNRMDTGSTECDLHIPEERYEELKTLGLVPVAGDMLITSRGTLGRCYTLTESDRFYFQDGMITWLYDFDKALTTNYLTHLFAMSGFRKQIDSLQAGSTVAYLSISMTKKLNVMLPPLELQNQFAAFIEQTDKSKVIIQQSLDTLETLKKSLMQEYFE